MALAKAESDVSTLPIPHASISCLGERLPRGRIENLAKSYGLNAQLPTVFTEGKMPPIAGAFLALWRGASGCLDAEGRVVWMIPPGTFPMLRRR